MFKFKKDKQKNSLSSQLTKINGGAPEIVLQFGCRKKARGGAFPFGVLAPIALEKMKAIIWDLEEKLKEEDKAVVGQIGAILRIRGRILQILDLLKIASFLIKTIENQVDRVAERRI